MLQPPLLRAMGLDRKIKLGRWAFPALGALRRARRLRGTAFDPFGHAHVRKVERALVDEYRRLVDGALDAPDARYGRPRWRPSPHCPTWSAATRTSSWRASSASASRPSALTAALEDGAGGPAASAPDACGRCVAGPPGRACAAIGAARSHPGGGHAAGLVGRLGAVQAKARARVEGTRLGVAQEHPQRHVVPGARLERAERRAQAAPCPRPPASEPARRRWRPPRPCARRRPRRGWAAPATEAGRRPAGLAASSSTSVTHAGSAIAWVQPASRRSTDSSASSCAGRMPRYAGLPGAHLERRDAPASSAVAVADHAASSTRSPDAGSCSARRRGR